jgi:hypothetical protein
VLLPTPHAPIKIILTGGADLSSWAKTGANMNKRSIPMEQMDDKHGIFVIIYVRDY